MRWRDSLAARGILSLIAALLLLAGTSSAALAQATPDASPTAGDAGPALGDAVVLYDSSGDELLQVAVTQLTDPDEALGNADRGFHWVAIEVVASNNTEQDVAFNSYALQLVDEQGFVYSAGFASRQSDDTIERPDFTTTTVPAGGSISGWLFFQVINDATVDWVLFNDAFGSQQFAVLANLAGATVEDGAEISFYDSSGDESGSITVDEIVTEFENVDSEVSPPRGTTTVGVSVTITNTGTGDLQPSTSSFTLIDDFGFLYYPAYYFRGEESLAQYPDLPSATLAAGDSVSGLILFDIPSDAQVNYIAFQPDYTQLYIIAQPGEGSTISGDELTPVPAGDDTSADTGDVPTEDTGADTGDDTGGETGDCVGVTEWGAETGENIAILDSFEEVENLEDVDPADLRDAADQIRDTADEQADVETPAVAQDTQDAVIALLEASAELFDEVADRLDDGDDPEEIQADLESNEEFVTAFTDYFTAFSNLSIACPNSNLENL